MRQSQLITAAFKNIPKAETSINSQLLIKAGFIDRLMAGVYSFLPLGYRVMSKIENIIREEMTVLGSQEVLLPALQPKEIWDRTGRWNTVDVLYKFTGSGDRELALGPTHEEVVTPLVGKFVQSYKNLPVSVFQIQTKFRNEVRPKSGLLRGREFRMKDMYSFHATEADLDAYYEIVQVAYERIFERCGIKNETYLTYASGGVFSKYSHEYQTITDYGEDAIYLCPACRLGVNREILAEQSNACPQCGNSSLEPRKAIEVGNIFKLMDRFSNAFELAYNDRNNTPQKVFMGCYGLGSSRVLGAVVEVHHDAAGIIWPREIAPFQVHLLNLSSLSLQPAADAIYERLLSVGIETLYDDRLEVGAGSKFAEADLIGIPLRVIISSKSAAKQAVELKRRNDERRKLVAIDNFLADPRRMLQPGPSEQKADVGPDL
jgi:prolyl-tRNA synthetase